MTGTYQHTIDAKGRLFLPARLREELGSVFYMTRGLDNCLFLYSAAAWKEIEERVSALSLAKARNLQRALFAGASRCELDAQGRMLIPAKLREWACLEKDATILGVAGRAEIWSTPRWEEQEAALDAEALAQGMEELGF